MTPEQLAQAFINVGLDTPEKVERGLRNVMTNLAIQRNDIAQAALRETEAEALRPVNAARQALVSERAQLTASLEAGLIPAA